MLKMLYIAARTAVVEVQQPNTAVGMHLSTATTVAAAACASNHCTTLTSSSHVLSTAA
jgi:hypothetical protein